MHRPPEPGDIIRARLAGGLGDLGGIRVVTARSLRELPNPKHIALLGTTAHRSARRKPAAVAKVPEPAAPVSEPAARSYGASGVDPSDLY